MNEQSREPLGQSPPINVVRRFLKIVVITTCVLLLIGAVFVASRYTTNRRLMALAKPSNPPDVDVSFGWDGPGPTFEWLERWIGMEPAFALLCRPVSLIVQGRDENISDATILSLLRESAGMKAVFIHNRDLPAGCLEAIATRHPVEVLNISLPVISGEDAKWLSRMTELKQLYVDQRVYVEELEMESRENDWSWLKTLSKLEILGVTMWDATDRDVIALAECPASKQLMLSGESLSDGAVRLLCEFPSLEHLTLEGPLIRLRFPQGQKFPSALQSIGLNCTGVGDESLAAIAGLPQLNSVSITGGTVSEAGMETLARLPALRHLYLYETKLVSDDGLKALVSSTSLNDVTMRRCGTTPAGLIHLMAIPNWTRIRFEDVGIYREPGADRPTVTPDTVEEFLSTRRRMQEE